jgi:hypothetical protein
LCGAALLATSMFGSAGVSAQTVTITGCAFLTPTVTAGNITITCSATKSSGGPSCTSLSVTTNQSAITLTANCFQGTNPITSYTFTGPGVSTTQAGSSLTIAAPTVSATYLVTASDGSSTSNSVSGSYTVGGVPAGTGTVDVSACAGKLMDLSYAPGNTRLSSDTLGSFGNANALVLRFTTPAVAGDTSSIQFSQIAGTPQVFRLATLATQPCQIATSAGSSGSILASAVSVSPVFGLKIGGTSGIGRTALTPGTTYYITVVNRNSYSNTAGSCTKSSCGVYMDLLN